MSIVLTKNSEKVIVWMHRTKKTQEEISKRLFITRQTFAKKIDSNNFDARDINLLRGMGCPV